VRIKSSHKNMRGLRLVGEEENGNASSPYGPMRAGLTTTHKIQSLQLSASLNLLERKVEDLTYKYLEVSSILTSVMTDLVRLGLIGKEQSTIDKENDSK
jgi:hypothetical protein